VTEAERKLWDGVDRRRPQRDRRDEAGMRRGRLLGLGLVLAGLPRVVGFLRGRRCLTRCSEGHTFGIGCLRRNW
jgi:hypothetical protein